MRPRNRALIASLALLSLLTVHAVAQGPFVPPFMSFQGRVVRPDGSPVPDGNYTVRVSLWDAKTGGTEKWNQTLPDIKVKNGIIAILIGLLTSAHFDGNTWMELKIDKNPPLSPRQPLSSVAYAFRAGSVADGSIGSGSLANNAVTGAKIAPGSISAASLASGLLDFWSLTGNAGTNPSVNFLGTTDDQPLLLKVNNRRAVRYAYGENIATAGFEFRTINVIGGSGLNSVGNGAIGATIAGGGKDFFTRPAEANKVTADFGAIGGGSNNTVSGTNGVVAGGESNTADGARSFVGGGISNTAGGEFGAIGGGGSNTASSSYATVPGGYDNAATGAYSFAAGRHAKANHTGTFVWNNNLGDFASSGNNQFLIRADGGVGINTSSPQAAFDVAGNSHFALNVGIGTANPLTMLHVVGSLHLQGTTQDISVQAGENLQIGHYDGTTFSERIHMDGNGHVGINDTIPTYRLELPNIAADGDGRARANRWDTYSSGRWKHNVTPIENPLEKVLAMRGVMFDWNPEHGGTHDIGFVAEEVGRVIPELVSWEADGKAALGMAYDRVTALLVEAIKSQQGQIKELKQRADAVAALAAENADLKRRLEALTIAVERLSVPGR